MTDSNFNYLDKSALKPTMLCSNNMVISKRPDGSYIGSHKINLDEKMFSMPSISNNHSIKLKQFFEDLAVPAGLAVVPRLYIPCHHDDKTSCEVITSDSNVELIKDKLIIELLDIARHIDSDKISKGKLPRKSMCKKLCKNARKTRKRKDI